MLPIVHEKPKAWIAIALKDTKGKPFPGAMCRVELPDGTIHQEPLNAEGVLRIQNIIPGTAHVNFPEIDPQHWHAA